MEFNINESNEVKFINPFVRVIDPIDTAEIMGKLEECARTCYQSYEKTCSGSNLIKSCIKSGHESILEHVSISVQIVTDRGVLSELTRHRIGVGYSVESTRYCNYNTKGFTMINPIEYANINPDLDYSGKSAKLLQRKNMWKHACCESVKAYNEMIKDGAKPEEARSVLNNSLKVDMKVTMNIRAWRHFFILRCAPSAHPHIKQIAIPLLRYFNSMLPDLFSDLEYDDVFYRDYKAILDATVIGMKVVSPTIDKTPESVNKYVDRKQKLPNLSVPNYEQLEHRLKIVEKKLSDMYKYMIGELSAEEFYPKDFFKNLENDKTKEMTASMNDDEDDEEYLNSLDKKRHDELLEMIKKVFGDDIKVHFMDGCDHGNLFDLFCEDDEDDD